MMNLNNCNKNYLYIEPYCCIGFSEVKSEVLIYNTITGKSLLFNDDFIFGLCKQITENGTNVTILNENQFNEIRSKFVNSLRNGFFGDIIYSPDSLSSPFLFSPNLYLNKDLYSIYKNKFQEGLVNNITLLKSVRYVDFVIDNTFSINYDNLNILISEVEKLAFLKGLNIILSEFNLDSKFYCDLIVMLSNKIKFKSITVDLNLIPNFRSILNLFIKNNFLIKCNLYFSNKNEDFFKSIDDGVLNKIYNYVFHIENIEQYNYFKNFANKYNISQFSFRFIGNDLAFVKNTLFFHRHELLATKQSISDVIKKSIFNVNYKGKLIISNDLSCYITPNFCVGNLNNDKIETIIYNSFFYDNSPWFLTRKQVEPCKDCAFNILCPSITEYELKYNCFNFCDYNVIDL